MVISVRITNHLHGGISYIFQNNAPIFFSFYFKLKKKKKKPENKVGLDKRGWGGMPPERLVVVPPLGDLGVVRPPTH